MTTHNSVSCPAAALSTVRRGRIVGQRASAQPATIAATATAAPKRAVSKRRCQTSASVVAPARDDAITAASASPVSSEW